jgi:Arc/MetJ-type ribon-helix-helix transcriptional regulator
MKAITIELPDKLAKELSAVVEAGWFKDEGEAMRLALLEFLRRHRLQLVEQFQLEDITWALQQRDSPG